VIPSTGSSGWDTILQIVLALALVLTLVVLIRNYRDR
jgi:hypothetical protein